VPTDRGYRFYVDLLLENRRSADRPEVADAIREAANDEPSIEGVLSHVSHVLSTESHHVGFAVAPATDEQRLRKIEFVSLEGARVLVVTLADGGQVTQKVVDAGEPLSPEELRRAAEYVNSQFAGLPIDQVQPRILARLAEGARPLRPSDDAGLQSGAARAGASRASQFDLCRRAPRRCWAMPQQSSEMSLQTLRTLVEMIEEKQRLVRLAGRVSARAGPGGGHRSRALAADLKPFSLVRRRIWTGAVAAASASSGQPACATRAPSAWWKAPPGP
jgi:heat-inducible transcriptional repressor